MKIEFQELVDQSLSGLTWHAQRQQQVLSAIDKEEPKVKKISFRTVLIAAMLVVMLATVAYAAANAKIQLSAKEYKPGLMNASSGVEVRFKPATNEYVAFKSYRPMWLPDGYALSYVGSVQYGEQVLMYGANGNNTAMNFYVVRSNAGIHQGGQGLVIHDVLHEEHVSVGQAQGILYDTPNDVRYLAWTDEEAGFGFFLMTADPTVDLIRVAESVQPDADLTPTWDETLLAMQALGDYRITVPPEGYSEAEHGGYYFTEGNDSCADVYRWYLNAEKNDIIHFEYWNGYSCVAEADRHENSESAAVNGLQGWLDSGSITWIDPSAGLIFTIEASGASAEQLLQMAESVQRIY